MYSLILLTANFCVKNNSHSRFSCDLKDVHYVLQFKRLNKIARCEKRIPTSSIAHLRCLPPDFNRPTTN